eukprot:s239_g14.t1
MVSFVGLGTFVRAKAAAANAARAVEDGGGAVAAVEVVAGRTERKRRAAAAAAARVEAVGGATAAAAARKIRRRGDGARGVEGEKEKEKARDFGRVQEKEKDKKKKKKSKSSSDSSSSEEDKKKKKKDDSDDDKDDSEDEKEDKDSKSDDVEEIKPEDAAQKQEEEFRKKAAKAPVWPLAGQLGGDLTPGSRILVFYDGEVVWHVRYLLAKVDQETWIVVTPDADIYSEDVSSSNPDWSAWRVWPVGSPLPFGVDGNMIYNFNPEPDAAAISALIQEGNQHAQQERVRLGIVAAGAMVPVGAPGPGGGVVPGLAGGGAAAAGAVPANPGVNPGGVGGPAGGGVAAAVHGGHAQLAQALNQPLDAAAKGSDDDARTLGISRDQDGLRFKEFRVAVQEAKPTEFSDWPVAGPRTVKYVINQMLDHGGSAMGHHQAWRTACKLQPTDGPAVEHEAWSKVLQTLMTYDQVDVTNLAGAEMIVRALQRIEEKHKFKLSSVDDAGEGALFMGSQSGARTGSIVCPKLTEWIGSEMQKEAMVAKERRKAREERALSRKGDKDAGQGNK